MFLIFYIFIFLFGLAIGSFLNCVIFRLALPNFSIRKNLGGLSRSFCPQCRHILSWLDLFPIFSFLFLKGKCRYCSKKISIQYPLVELATGIIFLLIFNPQNIINSVFMFYVSSSLIVIFIYDLKHYLIPDAVLLPAIAASIVYRILEFLNFRNWDLFGIWAAIIGSGFFLFIFLISKGRWMGFGDVKLAVLLGLITGFPNILVALFLAFFFGAIIGIILMANGKKKLKSEIPFGPFLISGTFIAIFWGDKIIEWYFKLFNF